MNISVLVIIHLKQRLLMVLKSVNVQLDIISIQPLKTLKLNDLLASLIAISQRRTHAKVNIYSPGRFCINNIQLTKFVSKPNLVQHARPLLQLNLNKFDHLSEQPHPILLLKKNLFHHSNLEFRL